VENKRNLARIKYDEMKYEEKNDKTIK